MTIHEIIGHPRYREFAEMVTAQGRPVLPDAYPWCRMGETDEQIIEGEMFHEDMTPMTLEEKRAQLDVIRAQEKLVIEWFRWWGGWEYLTRGKPAAPVVASPAPRPPAGMLF